VDERRFATKDEMKLRDTNRRRDFHLRLSVVLLLSSLFSVAALSKYSFALPHSSPSHWVSQTCKMREGRRVAAARVTAEWAQLPNFSADQHSPVVIAVPESHPPRIPISGFFRFATLRAPPAV